MPSAALHASPASTAKARLWPAMIFVLLGLNVSIVALTALLASRNATTRVEPEYDIKGLHWDQAKAELARGDALGWYVMASVTSDGLVRVQLTQKDGKPLAGATVRAQLFHHAAPRDVAACVLEESAPGTYELRRSDERVGTWHMDLTIVHAQKKLARSLDVETTWVKQ